MREIHPGEGQACGGKTEPSFVCPVYILFTEYYKTPEENKAEKQKKEEFLCKR